MTPGIREPLRSTADGGPQLRVALVDDQALFRAGLAMVLDSQEDMCVEWEAGDGADAVTRALAEPVDIVLMDVQMPRMDGIEATQRLLASGVTGPQGEPTRVIVLTTFGEQDYVMGSILAGASGFLLKDTSPDDLLEAVRAVASSSAVISPAATAELFRRMRADAVRFGGVAGMPRGMDAPGGLGTGRDVARGSDALGPGSTGAVPRGGAALADLNRGLIEPLTPREAEILGLMARGLNNAEVCERLFISEATVKTHVGRILAKTGSRDRVHAVLFALRTGWVTDQDLLQG